MFFSNKNFILKEILNWENEGIINSQTAKILSNKYENNQKNRDFIIKLLACLFIGIALIILIDENWEDIPRFIRISGLILLTLAIQIYGLISYIKNKNGNHIIIFFLGCLAYGASIILISQIYHLGQYMTDQTVLWAIGSLVFAIILKSISITILSFILSYIAFFINYFIYSEIDYSILIFFAISLYMALKKHSNFLLFLCIAFIYIFSIFTSYIYMGNKFVGALIIFITMALWLIAELLDKFKKLGFENFIRGFVYSFLLLILFYINLHNLFDFFYTSYEAIEIIKLLMLFILISALMLQRYYLAIMSLLCIFFFDNFYAAKAYFYVNIATSLLIVIFSSLLIYANRLKTGISILTIFILLKCLFLFGNDYLSSSLLFLSFSVILIILYKIRRKKKI